MPMKTMLMDTCPAELKDGPCAQPATCRIAYQCPTCKEGIIGSCCASCAAMLTKMTSSCALCYERGVTSYVTFSEPIEWSPNND